MGRAQGESPGFGLVAAATMRPGDTRQVRSRHPGVGETDDGRAIRGPTESGVRSRLSPESMADVAELVFCADTPIILIECVEVRILSSALAILDSGFSILD